MEPKEKIDCRAKWVAMAVLYAIILALTLWIIVAAPANGAPLPYSLRHPMTPEAAEAAKAGVEAEVGNPDQPARWRNDKYRRTLYFRFHCQGGSYNALHCDDPDCPMCAKCVYAKPNPKTFNP